MILVATALAFHLIRHGDKSRSWFRGAGMVFFCALWNGAAGRDASRPVLVVARRPNVPIRPRQIVSRTSIGRDGSGKAVRKRCAASRCVTRRSISEILHSCRRERFELTARAFTRSGIGTDCVLRPFQERRGASLCMSVPGPKASLWPSVGPFRSTSINRHSWCSSARRKVPFPDSCMAASRALAGLGLLFPQSACGEGKELIVAQLLD
jgi:hypothetical protein